MSRKIELVSYDNSWVGQFATEARVITNLVKPEFIAIHHIGSTAILGISAKPVIDILLEVVDIERLEAYNQRFEELGYQPGGEYGIPGRRYFSKEQAGIHQFHLHVYQAGHPEVERHLRFRDYLIAHPQLAQAYSQLKLDLAARFTNDSIGYTDAKTDFIQRIDDLARQG
jgi:GrpB-like predicted nucleotidyltransferase (UPF0157 family)